jgi:hypothetical protein
MNLRMTVHAGLGKHSAFPRGSRSLKGFEAGVRGSWVAGSIMAIYAYGRNPLNQKFIVVTAMGRVAIRTILVDRRMLPHKRPSFFGMASVAEFVDGIAFHHLGPKTPMVVMAVRAFHSSFPDGVVGLLVFLGPDCAVADVAELGLRGLQIPPGHGVNGVAVIAGNPDRSMLGHVPKG